LGVRTEEKNVKRESLLGQLQVVRDRNVGGELRETALRHRGSFNRKYCSKRLFQLFTHFVRRQKNLSVKLIIGEIIAMKESNGENENDSNDTKYL